MPHPRSSRGGRFRRVFLAAALVLLAICLVVASRLGQFLDKEDPLQHADAIFVLAGSRLDRALEAADLLRSGHAPVMMMTHQTPETAVRRLNARGLDIPFDEDLAKQILVRAGIPADAILIPPRIHDNTAMEAQTLRAEALRRGWRRVIVVSSKYHLRRAWLAMQRELGGTSVEIRMHGTRYDMSHPARWWLYRGDIRSILFETPKLVAYALGLGA